MPATRFGNPTSGSVSFTNAEVQQLQQAVQKLYQADYQGMFWANGVVGPADLLTELATEVQTNRSLPALPAGRE